MPYRKTARRLSHWREPLILWCQSGLAVISGRGFACNPGGLLVRRLSLLLWIGSINKLPATHGILQHSPTSPRSLINCNIVKKKKCEMDGGKRGQARSCWDACGCLTTRWTVRCFCLYQEITPSWRNYPVDVLTYVDLVHAVNRSSCFTHSVVPFFFLSSHQNNSKIWPFSI